MRLEPVGRERARRISSSAFGCTPTSTIVTIHALLVRDAQEADLPVLCSLLAELGYPTDPATLAPRFAAVRAAGDQVLLAERHGVAVAVATLHVTRVLHRAGPVGRVTSLVVTAEARRTGAGTALMQEAVQRLTAAGCVLLEVTSNRARADAHAFYERHGFTATSLKFVKPLEP